MLLLPAQVTVPVVLPDAAPMAVGIIGLQRSDRRLLAAAQQLGPLIQEAAAKLAASRAAAADAPADSSSASGSPAKLLANGSAKKQSPGVAQKIARLLTPCKLASWRLEPIGGMASSVLRSPCAMRLQQKEPLCLVLQHAVTGSQLRCTVHMLFDLLSERSYTSSVLVSTHLTTAAASENHPRTGGGSWTEGNFTLSRSSWGGGAGLHSSRVGLPWLCGVLECSSPAQASALQPGPGSRLPRSRRRPTRPTATQRSRRGRMRRQCGRIHRRPRPTRAAQSTGPIAPRPT